MWKVYTFQSNRGSTSQSGWAWEPIPLLCESGRNLQSLDASLSHSYNGNGDSVYLVGRLWKLNGTIQIQYSVPWLAPAGCGAIQTRRPLGSKGPPSWCWNATKTPQQPVLSGPHWPKIAPHPGSCLFSEKVHSQLTTDQHRPKEAQPPRPNLGQFRKLIPASKIPVARAKAFVWTDRQL